jgi:hypothetical protein
VEIYTASHLGIILSFLPADVEFDTGTLCYLIAAASCCGEIHIATLTIISLLQPAVVEIYTASHLGIILSLLPAVVEIDTAYNGNKVTSNGTFHGLVRWGLEPQDRSNI